MSRPIDADKLIQQIVKKKPEIAKARYTEGFNDAIMRVRSMVHSAPTLNVVEVEKVNSFIKRLREVPGAIYHSELKQICEEFGFIYI